MGQRIAIVEDEVELAKNYRAALERQGFTVELHSDRGGAEQAFNAKLPDLAIIDIGLGDEPDGGFDLCRALRAASATLPIIILTARDSEIDVIVGLKLGANDYLTKDISQAQLLARVTALMKLVDALATEPTHQNTIEHGPLLLDLDRASVSWNEKPVELTMTEFWIVECLARHPGHLKNREQLMDAAKIVVDDHTITSHIKRIRKKFKAVDTDADPIQTEYGAGYRWNPQLG